MNTPLSMSRKPTALILKEFRLHFSSPPAMKDLRSGDDDWYKIVIAKHEKKYKEELPDESEGREPYVDFYSRKIRRECL